MKYRVFGALVALFFASQSFTLGQSAQFYPLNMVKPGLKGIGKTVFGGTKVETFDVEILGVLKNIGPKQDMILARLSGQQLEETGVFAGMSGSPVYIDGKLLGAVAYAFPFSKAPIAGITPIEETVDIFKEGPGAIPKSSSSRFSLSQLNQLTTVSLSPPNPLPQFDLTSTFQGIPSLSSQLVPIATPLNLSGFSSQALRYFQPYLSEMGLVPVRGLANAEAQGTDQSPLEPGCTISVQMVRGDMDVSASGTLTHISGNRVYAFGHPFLGIGYTDMPLNKASVVTIIPSVMSSEKVSATTQLVGSIKQDRATGIMGVTGQDPDMIPVQLKLHTSRHELKEYNYEVVDDDFLTPFLMAFTVNNAIVSSERSVGGQTLQVKCTIAVKGHSDVRFENSVSDIASSPALAALSVAAPVNFLLNSGFDDMSMQKIELDISATEHTREATLDKVWQDKLEAKPGEEVNLTVFLRKPNGDIISQKYPIKVPDDVTPGPLKIMVADGESLTRSDEQSDLNQFVPENLQQLIKAINNIKKNDRLYIRVFRDDPGAVVGGEGLPDLPPSMLAILQSQKATGGVKMINKVVYAEHELPATNYVLKGQQMITIKVKG